MADPVIYLITTAGAGSVTAPAGYNTVTVEAIGGGGNGFGSGSSSSTIAGGGGGGYAKTQDLAVTAGSTVVYYSVGAAASDSWVRVGTNSAPTSTSDGCLGYRGTSATSSAAGTGGSTANSIGTTEYAGANGVRGAPTPNGGGAGGDGGAASGRTGGGSGDMKGGDGGTSTNAGTAPGGGGGGSSTTAPAGAVGRVRITFIAASLESALTSESTLSADLSTVITPASDLSALATLTAALTTVIALQADTTAQADLSASLTVIPSYQAAMVAESSLTAGLTTTIQCASDLTASTDLSGDLTTLIALQSDAAAQSALSAALTTQITPAADLVATADLTAGLTTTIQCASALTASSSLTADLIALRPVEASLSGEATLTPALTTQIRPAAALSANASLTADLTTNINAIAALVSVSNLLEANLFVDRFQPFFIPLDYGIFLAELTAYDPATASVITHRFSSGTGYDHAGTFYAPRIENPASFRREINDASGGRAGASLGELTLVNNDGGLNALTGQYFDGRTLTLKIGQQSGAYASFTTILNATVESVAFERERVSVRLRDKAVTLDQPFSEAKYLGNNSLPLGIEGTADDLKDQYKPRILGRIALMQPKLVNTSKLIYQVNNGAVDAILNVFDAGAYLSQGPDYTNQTDMETNAPGGGQWRACPSLGCFRIGSAPFGQVSVSVAEQWAYPSNSAAGLIQRILTEKGYTSGDWVAADFTTLNEQNAGSLGVIVNDGETTASLIDRICQSVGAWWGFDALGQFRVMRFDAPSGSAVATITEDDNFEMERQPESTLPPWRVTLRADINHAVQDRKSLAGVVPEDRAAWFDKDAREQKTEDAALKTSRLLAEETTLDTDLNGIATALAESARRQALYAVRRDVVTLTLANPDHRFSAVDLGSVVTITSNQLGYQAGRLLRVIGLGVDYQRSLLDLTLWG